MRYLSKRFYYFLADAQNRTCSWVDGGVVKNAIPTPLPQHPIGWKEIDLKWGTNVKYWSLNRSFGNSLTFINDGANIIRWHTYNGKGSEEELYIIILKQNFLTGLYELEYRGKIDFSTVKDDPYIGITIKTLEGGALRYLNANDSVTYEIPCDGRNPDAIKVIYDGTSLVARFNYSCPDVKIQEYTYAIPLTFISSTGDSVDVIHGTQSFEVINGPATDYVATSKNDFFEANTTTTLKGVVKLRVYNIETVASTVTIDIYKNDGTRINIYNGTIPAAPVYNQPILFAPPDVPININMVAGERVFFIIHQYFEKNVMNLVNTEIVLDFNTKKIPSTSFALRPLDSLKKIVELMSNGLCTADSKFFAINNKVVATCGDSLKNVDTVNAGIDGYNLKTSFSDWWSFYNGLYNLGMKIIDNVIWIEPKSDLYKPDQKITDLGEASKFSITMGNENLVNSIKNGYPNQTYNGLNQNDGKLEFNASQEWSTGITSVNKAYDLTSKWNAGCYIQEFIREVYTSGSKYNESDNGVYATEISDEMEALTTSIGTGIPINIINSPLAPIIISPAANEIIYNNKPTLRGNGTPGAKVGIQIDTVYEGYTTVDANGKWVYDITTVLSGYVINSLGVITSTGAHSISAGFADGTGHLLITTPLTTINITVYNADSSFLILSPSEKDSLYNNKPLIKGIAPAGATIAVSVDGVFLGNATTDGSCKWEFQVVNALSDRDHVLTAELGTQVQTKNISVSSTNLLFPLITNIESGSIICDNTPLIKGVAKPFEIVTLYLDFTKVDSYGNPIYLGRVTADSFGNWEYQVTVYEGAPLTDGEHFISTTPENQYVNITVSGFKLFRDVYDSISGVYDNTIFNINLSPRHQILAHANVLAGILQQQPDSKLKIVSSVKNRNLATTKVGVTTKESDDISVGGLGDPLFLNYYFNLTVKSQFTFEQIMKSIQTGYIKFTVKNYPLYALPIGDMSCKPAMEESQTFKLLAAPNNSLATFLLLSESVLFIQDYNNNMLSISNLNPLQFYKYNYTVDPKYQEPGIYDKPFFERHKSFISKPDYIQPLAKTDSIRLQFITAGIGAINLVIFDKNANVIHGYTMTLRTNVTIKDPYTLQEIDIPLVGWDTGEYKAVVVSEGVPIAESEWIFIDDTIPGTVLIEYSSSYNKLNGYFDAWSPMIRVEGVLMPAKPDSDFTTYEDEQKDLELLHAVPSMVQSFIIGEPFGIPDWMSLKINEILLLNQCNIEGTHYTRSTDSKMEETNIPGYPMSYFKTTVRKAINDSALVINDSSLPVPLGAVISTLDGEAFGQAGNVIQITIDKG